jgi:uncharacterized membrane protein
MKAVYGFVTSIGLHPVYTYGVPWWIVTALICGLVGFRLGRNGLLYSVAGVLLFLVLLHNFRGFAVRHNVFDTADYLRRTHNPGVPAPLLWDASYFLVAGSASLLGTWISAFKATRRDALSMASFGRAATLWAGVFCLVVGVVVSVFTVLVASKTDSFPFLASMTYGYAVAAFGLIVCIVALFKDRLFDFELN